MMNKAKKRRLIQEIGERYEQKVGEAFCKKAQKLKHLVREEGEGMMHEMTQIKKKAN